MTQQEFNNCCEQKQLFIIDNRLEDCSLDEVDYIAKHFDELVYEGCL